MRYSRPVARRAKPMRSAASLATAFVLAAGPVFGWSCASDEPLVPQVSAEERARISAEVAAERAAAERAACRRGGGEACDPPASSRLPLRSRPSPMPRTMRPRPAP